jgi:hypothetical protein
MKYVLCNPVVAKIFAQTLKYIYFQKVKASYNNLKVTIFWIIYTIQQHTSHYDGYSNNKQTYKERFERSIINYLH